MYEKKESDRILTADELNELRKKERLELITLAPDYTFRDVGGALALGVKITVKYIYYFKKVND